MTNHLRRGQKDSSSVLTGTILIPGMASDGAHRATKRMALRHCVKYFTVDEIETLKITSRKIMLHSTTEGGNAQLLSQETGDFAFPSPGSPPPVGQFYGGKNGTSYAESGKR